MHLGSKTDVDRPLTSARPFLACATALTTLFMLPIAQADAGGDRARLGPAERALKAEMNRTRAAHGLHRLRHSGRLAKSADYHCWDMLNANFFAHSSSNGTPMPVRVRRYKRASRIGENLAYVGKKRPRKAARAVVGMWMNSPSHRASLLSGTFTRVGVARRVGSLGGGRVAVYTVDFSSAR